DCDRLDQGRLHRRAQLHGLLNRLGQALQNDVENTAGFAGFDLVCSQSVECLWILPHGIRQGGSAFYGGAYAGKRLLESGVLLVGCENLKTLHQGKSSVNHYRELAEEDRNVLGLDL